MPGFPRYGHIYKIASCSSCIRCSLRLAPNYILAILMHYCCSLLSPTIQVALSKASSHCHVLEERNAVLWRVRSATMGKDSESCQIMTLVNSKASQWQVI